MWEKVFDLSGRVVVDAGENVGEIAPSNRLRSVVLGASKDIEIDHDMGTRPGRAGVGVTK
jgi:hypothetical protein